MHKGPHEAKTKKTHGRTNMTIIIIKGYKAKGLMRIQILFFKKILEQIQKPIIVIKSPSSSAELTSYSQLDWSGSIDDEEQSFVEYSIHLKVEIFHTSSLFLRK
jgi:hypothetical protein